MSGGGRERVLWADALRCAAVAGVIVLHVSGSQLSAVSLGSAGWHVLNAYNSLSRWCVPVFIMLSGAFMLDPRRELTLSRLAGHHILRLCVALAAWGGFFALAGYFVRCGGAPDWAGIGACLLAAVRGNTHYHLWFLYMMIGLYLITPVLRVFVRGAAEEERRVFFLLAVLFACLLPTLLRLRPSQAVSTYLGYLNVKLVLGHVGYYTAGYYLRTCALDARRVRLAGVLGLLGAAATLFGTAALSLRRGSLVQTLYEYDSPNVAAMAVAVFVLVRAWLEGREKPAPVWVGPVAGVSIGIYLVHEFFLLLLRQGGITAVSFPPVLAVPALSALVFACAFAAAWLLSRLPVLGRYLT